MVQYPTGCDDAMRMIGMLAGLAELRSLLFPCAYVTEKSGVMVPIKPNKSTVFILITESDARDVALSSKITVA